ncbi:glycerol-3-phosphate 1-O-acyltransferase PlsB [Acinetobacter sp. c1-l78]|uniref:glycerol-3-phosphate 1-O-acyltransferase PlsB n=1 Tax=Acinetobacter sp. c1-l78 TaxID=3342803 RepID=UPI0035B7344C
MVQSNFAQLSRRVSNKLLNMVVKPHLIGDTPTQSIEQNTEQNQQKTTFIVYVLQSYSRSNAMLLDNETERLKLTPALVPFQYQDIKENKSVIFLKKPTEKYNFPPRLIRLIEACEKYSELDIRLVPVTILWGRAPDKEDSLLKLLFTDSWATPSKVKQLINIGLHSSETYIEFHDALSLREMIDFSKQNHPNLSPATHILTQLNQLLDSKRAAVLGPDLSDRRNVVNSIIKSRDIQEAILQESLRNKISTDQAERRAIAHLDEIASDYSASTVRFADSSLNRLWTQLYDGVEVHHFNTVRELADKYEIIYTPCHRSHIDYLLLSFVIYQRGLRVPHVAAGNNLNIPFVGQLLRGGGAFFMRRTFQGAPLYSAVFKEYLYSILSRNTPLEYFIEGGRSRTGRLLAPRTGMLAMTVHGHLRGRSKPIVFIPTYIGYERLMEGATYVGEMEGKPKEAESILGILKTVRKIEKIFGKVHVNFGEPVFLDDILAKHNLSDSVIERNQDSLSPELSQVVTDAAYRIMENINRAAVINPVSLLSLILLSTTKHTLDEKTCIAQLEFHKKLFQLAPYDERTIVTDLSGEDIIAYGLKLKLIKRIQHVLGDIVAIEDGQAILLTYFRNNILHLFCLPSLIAALVSHNGRISQKDLNNVIKALYPFLQAEFFLKWQREDLEPVIAQYCDALVSCGVMSRNENGDLQSPLPNSEYFHQLNLLGRPVQKSLERYFMAVTLIHQRGQGKLSTKQVEDLSHLLGQRLSALHEFNSPESFDRALFQGFLKVLAQQEFIKINEQGLIEFDQRFDNIALNAHLVLDEDTLNMLAHITTFSDEELQNTLETLANQKSKLRKKLK